MPVYTVIIEANLSVEAGNEEDAIRLALSMVNHTHCYAWKQYDSAEQKAWKDGENARTARLMELESQGKA